MPQLLEQTIGHIACELPGATRVFHTNRLDFCCGGDKTLREAIARRKIADPGPIVLALQELANQQTQDERDWRKVSSGELIDHILTRFHDKHREDLPELIRLAR